MGKKRKSEKTEEEIRRKIKKLEGKLRRRSNVIYSSEDEAVDPGRDDNIVDPLCPPLSERFYDEFATPAPEALDDQDIILMSQPDAPEVPTSSVLQPGTSAETSTATAEASSASGENADKALDESLLNILGDAPKTDTVLGKNIHKDIATRWQEILSKGLSKETKEKLLKEYLIPANCDLLVPPILNPEAKAALPDVLVKRDYSLSAKQKQIGVALAALGQATDLIISNEISVEKILKPISDACCLLCDSHNIETVTRRSFVTNSINTTLKDTLIDAPRDKYLFGENITEKLKAAKPIQRSGESLRSQQKPQFNKNNFNNQNRYKNTGNFRALHPKAAGRYDAGPARPGVRSAVSQMPARRPRAPPPPRPPPPPPPPPPRRSYNNTRR